MRMLLNPQLNHSINHSLLQSPRVLRLQCRNVEVVELAEATRQAVPTHLVVVQQVVAVVRPLEEIRRQVEGTAIGTRPSTRNAKAKSSSWTKPYAHSQVRREAT